jgi:hypothetical protein
MIADEADAMSGRNYVSNIAVTVAIAVIATATGIDPEESREESL